MRSHPVALAIILTLLSAVLASAQIQEANNGNEQNMLLSASELDYPPLSIVTEEGMADGFSVELLRAALGAVGRNVSFYVGPWSEIKEDLVLGKIDVLPLVGRTPEREAIYDFTVPYLTMHGAVFARAGDRSITSLESLKDKELVVMNGDNSEEYARRENLTLNLVSIPTYEEAFRQLSEGKHDAILVQDWVGKQIVKDLMLTNIEQVLTLGGFKQDFTFAVKEGDSEHLSLLNEGLSRIIADGTYDRIYLKWFGVPRYNAGSPAESTTPTFDPELVRSKGLETASMVAEYISLNEKTVKELQEDAVFNKITVQSIGETGYTLIYDPDSGEIYFHPQKSLVGTNVNAFRWTLPSFWKLINHSLGKECKESSGYYDWKEFDGTITQKYLVNICVAGKTKDNRRLQVSATSYINEDIGRKYVFLYEVKEASSFAKASIKQKAEDVSRQIEIYLRSNPTKTLADLQADTYFRDIAVQPVGKTGYTAVTDYNTLVSRFHKNPAIIDLDLSTLRSRLPGFWEIMSRTKGGREAEGFYDWQETNGSIRKKYMYVSVVPVLTADGVGLHVAATTYLDEFDEPAQDIIPKQEPDSNNVLYFGGIGIITLLVIFSLARTRSSNLDNGKLIFMLVSLTILILSLMLIQTYLITMQVREDHITQYISKQSTLLRGKVDSLHSNLDLIVVDAKVTSEDDRLNLHDEQLEYEILTPFFQRLSSYLESAYYLDQNGQVLSRVPFKESYRQTKKNYLNKPGVNESIQSKSIVISLPFATDYNTT
ncbi:MAG: transporter substrate-binding domain-containing protein, partial [Nanoarchaeota archaeon]|nr:transporter substrate-binding domain-containing protein [Nanoarchaeota archaeon]